MLISPAYAQAGGAGGGFDIVALLPLVLIFVVFYFLLIRPQQKRMKVHRDMLAALRRGDRIVTSGGIIGTITKIAGDNELVVEIADGVRVRLVRGMVSEVLAKTEPAGRVDDAEQAEPEEAAAAAAPEGDAAQRPTENRPPRRSRGRRSSANP